MNNELDIVDQLLGNEGIADCHKPRSKKKAVKLSIDNDVPDSDDEGAVLEPHTKHMDPVVKGRDATEKVKDRADWIGDCHKLSKAEKEGAGLPDEAYIVIDCVGNPNASACVHDPVHSIYGWGEDTLDAVKNCLQNIREWRAEFPELIPNAIKGFEERLAKHGNPYDLTKATTHASKAYQSKNIEGKTTTDILKAIGL